MSNATATLGDVCFNPETRTVAGDFDKQFLDTLFLDASTPLGSGHALICQQDTPPSKLYTASTDINPLVAAAAPLLSLVAPLRQSQHCAQVTQLQQQLLHEVRVFETQAVQQGYATALIFATRFALCANLDEAIARTSWGEQSDWGRHSLTRQLFGESYTLDHFFALLKQLQHQPERHIDALELLYVCMSLGLKGPFQSANISEQRDELMDELYEQIRAVRGDFDKDLTLNWRSQISTTNTLKSPFPWWLSGLLGGMLVLSIYTGFSYMLSTAEAPVYNTLADIEQTLLAPLPLHQP